ncbi:MAG: hypothetical protein MSS48_02135 [Clostridiales bacterium]|nr:hypothetical protein [Clostridiales bacterium]
MTDIKRTFKVLEGGMARTATPLYQTFHSAWITNTRLMGVICLCIRWTGDSPRSGDLYQFFYFEAEGQGFDRFEWHDGVDKTSLRELEASLIGGLGGRKVAIRQQEAVHLAQYFIRYNKKYALALPEPEDKYLFLLEMDGTLTEEQQAALFDKSCVRLTSKNALANYFLMRVFGHDFPAAARLAADGVELDLFPDLSVLTYYRNEITMAEGRSSCRCESLIETTQGFRVIVTALTFTGMKISGFRCISNMRISDMEAYMNLAHSEFVTVYRYEGNPEEFVRSSTELTKNAMILPEHNGRTFMIYNPTNDHVKEPVYLLYNDLTGVYHMDDSGQLLVSSATLRNIRKLELDLHFSPLREKLTPVSSFEFNEPVLMQYLDSDFTDFLEFIDSIKVE